MRKYGVVKGQQILKEQSENIINVMSNKLISKMNDFGKCVK